MQKGKLFLISKDHQTLLYCTYLAFFDESNPSVKYISFIFLPLTYVILRMYLAQ